MVLLDACVRLLPGVMGAAESAEEESFAADGLLEYPHYTRPAEWNGLRVPEVLLSGHHADVAAGAAPRPSAPPASAGPTCGRAAPRRSQRPRRRGGAPPLAARPDAA
jgi:tRNA (guanine37-N1)-methyltransferase